MTKEELNHIRCTLADSQKEFERCGELSNYNAENLISAVESLLKDLPEAYFDQYCCMRQEMMGECECGKE